MSIVDVWNALKYRDKKNYTFFQLASIPQNWRSRYMDGNIINLGIRSILKIACYA